MDQAEMVNMWGIAAIKKDGEAECMDDVEIAATEGVELVGMYARLVVVPKSFVALANLIFERTKKSGRSISNVVELCSLQIGFLQGPNKPG